MTWISNNFKSFQFFVSFCWTRETDIQLTNLISSLGILWKFSRIILVYKVCVCVLERVYEHYQLDYKLHSHTTNPVCSIYIRNTLCFSSNKRRTNATTKTDQKKNHLEDNIILKLRKDSNVYGCVCTDAYTHPLNEMRDTFTHTVPHPLP